MIGASGAVSSVLGAYLLLFPYATVLTLVMFGFFIRFIHIPRSSSSASGSCCNSSRAT